MKNLLLVIIVVVSFVACSNEVYNFDESPIEYLGHLNFGTAYSVRVKNNIAYVSHNKGVEIVDVSISRSPTKLSRIKIGDGAFGIESKGDYLYIAGDTDGFFIVDIKDPKFPKIISNFIDQEGSYSVVKVKDDHAFVGLRDGKLIILDIKIPTEPRELKTLNIEGGLSNLVIAEDLLYLGTYNGIKLLDINNIEDAQIVDIGLNDVFGQGMVWFDSKLYIGAHKHGVKIFDASNYLKPQLIGSFNDGGEANGLYLVGQKLYVADSSTSVVEVLDVSNPQKPMEINEFLNCHPHGIVVKNNLLYIATVKQGLYILKLPNDV